MKRTALKAFALLGISLAVGAAAAGAQDTIRINIPFDFTVGESNLPAGVYEVQRIFGDGVALRIRCEDCKSEASFMTIGVYAKKEVAPRMVFHRYGSRYFLNQLWMGGSSSGRQLLKVRLETELALRETSKQEVVLAAQLR